MNFRFIISICMLMLCSQLSAQVKSGFKFGKVNPEDFKTTIYSLDSSANAVVLADIGSTDIVGNDKGWFSLEFKRYRRVHILNKNGYDIAQVDIGLFTDGESEEKLTSLKAVTYNLESGKVVETKLDTKSGVFKDKINKNLLIKKFTFPNIKEGSIIEFEYVLRSDFTFNLQPWIFQGKYPCLWSEYNVGMPQFFYYVTMAQGYHPFFIKDQKDRTESYMVMEAKGTQATERTSITTGVTDFRWVMKDIPMIKEENFTSTINNFIARLDFQLAEYRDPLNFRLVMGSWRQACLDLLKNEDFGYTLKRDNYWLGSVMDEAKGNVKTDLEKAKNIFTYVRDNLTCTNFNRKYLEHPLKAVLKSRNGSVAEINLLLTAMLAKADLEADPVILSTRPHGFVYALYPLLDKFNYVVSRLTIGGKYYYLDASRPGLGFARLPTDAYNGHARVVNEDATPVELTADSVLESKVTSVIIINNEQGNLTGNLQQTPGYYESYKLRNSVNDQGKDQYFNSIKKAFTNEIDISNATIDSLRNYEDPVFIKYDFVLKAEKEDILYFSPMFTEGMKENPFKSADRFYPVEMPYTFDETFLIRMDVPSGYVTDELPKPIKVMLNENGDGFFEFLIAETNGTISLRSRIKLKRAIFYPEEYETLREFFNLVVKKHGEQIVFKKKK